MTALDEAIAKIEELTQRMLQDDNGVGKAQPSGHTANFTPSATAVANRSAIAPLASASGAVSGPPAAAAPQAAAAAAAAAADQPAAAQKPRKEKKPAAPAPEATSDDLFGKALLQVSRVVAVEEVEGSDKLYRTKVDVGGGETKQIIAGLRKFVPREELEGSLVVTILNLKAAKLAGELSEGMILAAVQSDASAPHGELVAPIRPDGNPEPGARVYLEGGHPSEAPAKTLKSTHWGGIKERLRAAAGAATFDGQRLVTAAGGVLVPPQLPDGAAIS